MSDSVQFHGLQLTRLLCPSPTPRSCSNSRPLSRWCHPTISSSVVPFSSCLQSFPASGSSNELVLRISWPKYWSFSFSINPSSEHSGLIAFRMDWLDLLAVWGTLKFSPAPKFKSISQYRFQVVHWGLLPSHKVGKRLIWIKFSPGNFSCFLQVYIPV